MSKNTYKNQAIFGAIRKYVHMNDLVSRICCIADPDYKALCIQSVKPNKAKLHVDRDKNLNIKDILIDTIVYYITDADELTDMIISDVEDEFEFTPREDMIDIKFIDQFFNIEQTNKNVILTVGD